MDLNAAFVVATIGFTCDYKQEPCSWIITLSSSSAVDSHEFTKVFQDSQFRGLAPYAKCQSLLAEAWNHTPFADQYKNYVYGGRIGEGQYIYIHKSVIRTLAARKVAGEPFEMFENPNKKDPHDEA